MAKYKVNWEDSDHGNSIKSGEDLEIEVLGAQFISGGVYKDNLPIFAIFEMGDKAKISIKIRDKKEEDGTWFSRGLLEGQYTLKIRTHIPTSTNYIDGWDDDFYVTS